MPLWSDKRCSWIALSSVQGLGSVTIKNLLTKFGDPDEIFKASISEISRVDGIRKEIAENIVDKKYDIDPAAELKRVEKHGARIVTFHDSEYPPHLREIHDPPVLLYVKGKTIPDMNFVAIVGSRNATHYGLKAAEELAQGIARRGLGIVSGMAMGIDAASHWGCLTGKGFTVAVLGSGLDKIYPAKNRKLYNKIIEYGAVISEFPLGTSPSPPHFPKRNRIISGLSRGVVVVEATKNSGSLITASLALEQGRDVFAVPGSIKSFKSRGCHFLIKQGAMLAENSDDIMEGLGFNYPGMVKTDRLLEKEFSPMNDTEKKVYEILGEYPLHIDEIKMKGNFSTGDLSGILTKMELKGIVKQLPGKMFVR
ncbi:DNA-processing protein DprA [Thermodesulfobacteriota bacterium]